MPKAPNKTEKTHIITLSNGAPFEVKVNLWNQTTDSFRNYPGFKALRVAPLAEYAEALPPNTPMPTEEEQAQGSLYYFFAYILSREGSKNPMTKVSKDNHDLLKKYIDLGGDPNFSWKNSSLLMLVLERANYHTIGWLLEHTALNVNWCATGADAVNPRRYGYGGEDDHQTHPQTALQAFTKRYEPRTFQGLHTAFIKEAFKQGAASIVIPDAAESTIIEARDTEPPQGGLLTPLQELEMLFNKLREKGVDFYGVDQRGNNPLLWATELNAQELMPFLIRQYTEDGSLGQMILQSNTSESCALSAMITKFVLPSKVAQSPHPYLRDLINSITSVHTPLFRKFVEHKRFPNIVASLICDSPQLLGVFEAACTRCGIQIPSPVWALILKEITQIAQSRQIKLFTAEILQSITQKAANVTAVELIRDTLRNGTNEKYPFLIIALELLKKQHDKAELERLINAPDDERGWNLLCYLIADLKRPDLHGKARYYFKNQLSSIRSVWKQIVTLSSAETREHARVMMGINPAIFEGKPAAVITAGGLIEPLEQPAPAQALAPDPGIRLNAQSTHSTIGHASTSDSEIILRDRYRVSQMGSAEKAALWTEMDAYYLSTDALPLQNKTPYLENLRRSVESETPIPGDTNGSIKAALTNRWKWIASRSEAQLHVRIIKTAFTEYTPNHPEVPAEKVLKFIEVLDQGYDWFAITYKKFKEHVLRSTYKDAHSQQTAADVVLSIWLAINDPRYELSNAIRAELKFRLGIAMVEIVHQYQALQPTCASGTHNLLIDAVGKGDHIPGVYAFSMQAERALLIETLKGELSIEAHFSTLSASEKITWFQSTTAYEQALKTCREKLAHFIQYGGNEQFQFFTPEEIEAFHAGNDRSWEAWRAQHADEQPTNEALITSALRSLSASERSEVLSSLESLCNFIKLTSPGVPDNAVDERLFQTVKQSVESTEDTIELRDYSKFFSSKTDLPAIITQHWNDYYSMLEPEKVSTLLVMLDMHSTGNHTHDKILFAKVDLERLLDRNANTLTDAEKTIIRENYQVWLDALQQEAVDLLASELETIGEALEVTTDPEATNSMRPEETTIPTAALVTPAAPAITPHAALTTIKRRRSHSPDDEQNASDEPACVAKRRPKSPA